MLIRENNQLNLQFNILNQKVGKLETILEDIEKRDDNIYRTIFNADPISSSVRNAGFGPARSVINIAAPDNGIK